MATTATTPPTITALGATDSTVNRTNSTRQVEVFLPSGGMSADQLMLQAQTSLRCVQWSDVTSDLFRPDARGLLSSFRLSRPLAQGESIDLFVCNSQDLCGRDGSSHVNSQSQSHTGTGSYSAQDAYDGLKAVVTEMTADPRESIGPNPTIWLRSCCVDPKSNIGLGLAEHELRLQPMWIAACSKVVLLYAADNRSIGASGTGPGPIEEQLECMWQLYVLSAFSESSPTAHFGSPLSGSTFGGPLFGGSAFGGHPDSSSIGDSFHSSASIHAHGKAMTVAGSQDQHQHQPFAAAVAKLVVKQLHSSSSNCSSGGDDVVDLASDAAMFGRRLANFDIARAHCANPNQEANIRRVIHAVASTGSHSSYGSTGVGAGVSIGVSGVGGCLGIAVLNGERQFNSHIRGLGQALLQTALVSQRRSAEQRHMMESMMATLLRQQQQQQQQQHTATLSSPTDALLSQRLRETELQLLQSQQKLHEVQKAHELALATATAAQPAPPIIPSFQQALYEWQQQHAEQLQQWKAEGASVTSANDSSDVSGASAAFEFDFFCSHKKRHTRHGTQSEEFAIRTKDALAEKGLAGFLDIDDLDCVNFDDLTNAVRRSKMLLLFLNDECLSSSWVRHELLIAVHFRIPVLCVINQDLYIKETLIEQHQLLGWDCLFQEQVIFHTTQGRRQCYDRITAACMKVQTRFEMLRSASPVIAVVCSPTQKNSCIHQPQPPHGAESKQASSGKPQ